MGTNTFSNDISLSNITNLEPNLCEKKKVETKKALRKKLQESELKNEELQNSIKQKTDEITELKNKITSLNDLINSTQIEDLGKGSSIASSKIFELSRKNRQLTAELEASKSRYTKINLNYLRLEKEFEEYKKKNTPQTHVKKEPCCDAASHVQSLQEQLNTTKQKLFESLNNNNTLKNDLKLAQKCIQQEIGENFNLTTLASSNSKWRGRSQQILALQNKVAELKEKLENMSGRDSSSCTSNRSRKSEISRKMEIEELTSQINALKLTVEDQKNKISALKTRNKNLTDEAMNYKLKTFSLMEKNGNTDNSNQVLNEKINIQKYMYENKIQNLNKEIEDLKLMKKDAEEEHRKTREKLNDMKLTIDAKQEEIDELNGTIKKLENNLRSVCGDFLFSCRDLRKDEYVAILDSLEFEKAGLMQRNQILCKRLDEEREKVTSLNDQISKLKTKYIRCEARLKEIQKDQEMQQEKKKRQNRIAEFTQSLSNCTLPTLVIENSNSCPNFNHQDSLCQTASNQQTEKLENFDLKNKLELAEERILLLEDKITQLANEKDVDMRIFHEIVTNSKHILLNTIQQNKRKQSSEIALQTEFDPTMENSCKDDDLQNFALFENFNY